MQTPANDPTDDSGLEPPEHMETSEYKFLDTDKDNSPTTPAAKAEALSEPDSRNASKRQRRPRLEALLAEAQRYTSMLQSVQDVPKSRGKPRDRSLRKSPRTVGLEAVKVAQGTNSCNARGVQDLPGSRRASVDKHFIKFEDEPGENRRFSSRAATDGPVTIVDMTMVRDCPAPHRREVAPQRQSALKTAFTSSGGRGSRATLFAPETKMIPKSREEEGDGVMGDTAFEVEEGVMGYNALEVEVEVERWEEDPNSQLVFD